MFDFNFYIADSSCAEWAQFWAEIVGIIVTALVSKWIVNTIQKKVTNERSLKDYIIGEISNIQENYRDLILSIRDSHQSPKLCKATFHRLASKINDLMNLISTRYDVEQSLLYPYQTGLQEIIEDDNHYTSVPRRDSRFTPTDETVVKVEQFEKENGHLFYDLIAQINDGQRKSN